MALPGTYCRNLVISMSKSDKLGPFFLNKNPLYVFNSYFPGLRKVKNRPRKKSPQPCRSLFCNQKVQASVVMLIFPDMNMHNCHIRAIYSWNYVQNSCDFQYPGVNATGGMYLNHKLSMYVHILLRGRFTLFIPERLQTCIFGISF